MRWLIPLLFAATPALADTVVANGTIRSMSVIRPADVRLVAGDTPGAILDLAAAIGMEARVNLYPGRPIRPGDLREPAVINRNEIITLQYDANGLLIVTEGRALDRAGIGERLRVLNLSSRTTVTATVQGAGLATVGPSY